MLLRTTLSPELWWREKVDELLRRDQVPADCVSDLPTKRNALSVYEVADEDAAERVVAALALQKAIGGATQKQSLRDMSGLMFDARLLANLGIATKRIKGNTPDQTVNDWYLDLIDLTGSQLVELAKVLLQNTEPVTSRSNRRGRAGGGQQWRAPSLRSRRGASSPCIAADSVGIEHTSTYDARVRRSIRSHRTARPRRTSERSEIDQSISIIPDGGPPAIANAGSACGGGLGASVCGGRRGSA